MALERRCWLKEIHCDVRMTMAWEAVFQRSRQSEDSRFIE